MPALTIPVTGNGATVSGLGLTTLIKKISGFDVTLDTLDISALASTGFKKLIKSDLTNSPSVTVECYWTGAAIAIGGSSTTFTITYPGAGSFAGTGFITAVKYPDAENGSVMMGSYTVTFDGATGPAFTAA
jgi:hypothetical protein